MRCCAFPAPVASFTPVLLAWSGGSAVREISRKKRKRGHSDIVDVAVEGKQKGNSRGYPINLRLPNSYISRYNTSSLFGALMSSLFAGCSWTIHHFPPTSLMDFASNRCGKPILLVAIIYNTCFHQLLHEETISGSCHGLTATNLE